MTHSKQSAQDILAARMAEIAKKKIPATHKGSLKMQNKVRLLFNPTYRPNAIPTLISL